MKIVLDFYVHFGLYFIPFVLIKEALCNGWTSRVMTVCVIEVYWDYQDKESN